MGSSESGTGTTPNNSNRSALHSYFDIRSKMMRYYVLGFKGIWLLLSLVLVSIALAVVCGFHSGNWLLSVLLSVLMFVFLLSIVFLVPLIIAALGLFHTEQPAIEQCKKHLENCGEDALRSIDKMAEADLSNLRTSATLAVSFYVPLIAVLLKPELKLEDSLTSIVVSTAFVGFLSHLLMVAQSNADTVIRLAIMAKQLDPQQSKAPQDANGAQSASAPAETAVLTGKENQTP